MSEYLRTALAERATGVDFRPPDLSAIRHAGGGRVRRRHAAAAFVSSGAVALVAGLVAVLAVSRGAPHAPVASPWPLSAVTWAYGSTIHVGEEQVPVGRTVAAFVRTGAGFAVIDDSNDIYSVTAAGVARIGRLPQAPSPGNSGFHPRVVADPRGTLIGWVGEDQRGALTLQTYDQATGQGRSYSTEGALSADHASFDAIDGRTGYWRTPAGQYLVDLDTGAKRLMDRSVGNLGIYSAAQGMLAFRGTSGESGVDAIYAGRSLDSGMRLERFGLVAYLNGLVQSVQVSPTGDWVSLGVAHYVPLGGNGFGGGSTTADVYDAITGEQRMFDVPGQGVPLVWLDDVTLQVLSDTDDDLSLYRCTVTDGSCRLAVDLGRFTTPFPVMPGGSAPW